MITTIGVSYVLFNVVLLTLGADSKNFPNPLPALTLPIGGAVLRLREVLIWIVSLVLMAALTWFVQFTRIGKAMRATAQDPEAARMMGSRSTASSSWRSSSARRWPARAG